MVNQTSILLKNNQIVQIAVSNYKRLAQYRTIQKMQADNTNSNLTIKGAWA